MCKKIVGALTPFCVLQRGGLGGDGGVLFGDSGGGVRTELVQLGGQVVISHGKDGHGQVSGVLGAVQRHGGYRDAVVRACENAQVLGAARGDTVKLGVEVAEMPQGLAGTDDKDAQVQAKITLAVVTMDENARVTSAIGDMTEPELTVSADGTVSAPREPVYTKNELGDRYGMRSASALGKEWYEHSAGWCGYLKGKNAVEIGKLSADGTDADLKALCTISVTDLQKAVLKAMAEQ